MNILLYIDRSPRNRMILMEGVLLLFSLFLEQYDERSIVFHPICRNHIIEDALKVFDNVTVSNLPWGTQVSKCSQALICIDYNIESRLPYKLCSYLEKHDIDPMFFIKRE